MIPSVRRIIDQANEAAQQGDGDGDNAGRRVPIPPAEMDELKEFRKREHTQRARELNNSRILEWEQAEARANLIMMRDVDEQRPYGLPQGEAKRDVWIEILKRVHDWEDIANLRDTCQLFWSLLEMKYKAHRLTEVVLEFTQTLGGLPTLLSLRQVCKSCKLAVDQRLHEDKLPHHWFRDELYRPNFRDEQWNCKPELRLGRNDKQLFRLYTISGDLDLEENVPIDTFPIRIIEFDNSGKRCCCRQKMSYLTFLLFQPVLEVVGGCVSCFEYSSVDSSLKTYNQLRSWVLLMPNLKDLAVYVLTSEPQAQAGDPLLVLGPFPHCPKLKRFSNTGSGMRAPFMAQILSANPEISDVFLAIDRERENPALITTALDSLHLERFNFHAYTIIPSHHILEFRFQWPLKYLCLTGEAWNGRDAEEDYPGIPSKTMINFINHFRQTLEELAVTWKLQDTGGFLDLPKLKKLSWKLTPNFMSLEFMVSLESLECLCLNLVLLQPEINGSWENVRTFFRNMDVGAMFPMLRQIRALREDRRHGWWLQV